MLGNLLGSLIDKEQITHDTIQTTLEKLSEELNCTYQDLFIMIKPVDDSFTMKFWVYKLEEKTPKLIREIPLSEVLGD
jgi:uncharacterized FlaG/YvyC family protein